MIMSNKQHNLIRGTRKRFKLLFGRDSAVCAYAPGRIEVLGNHTDYNQGYVLSAAIDMGVVFAAAPAMSGKCRAIAPDMDAKTSWDIDDIQPSARAPWANYVKGVLAGLSARKDIPHGFDCLIAGNLPLGAGLSSSAALEISCGMALSALYGVVISRIELAKLGQAAEHQYAGVKCGLLDQVTSLFGSENKLVMTDFRSLAIKTIPVPETPPVCFVVLNTGVKHTLVESEYNDRRESCEKAAAFFRRKLPHPVIALRDVSWREWERLSPAMHPVQAARAAHIIGENERVRKSSRLLKANRIAEFGRLMFESHDSSRRHFANSCDELDFIVDKAATLPGVFGARLTGGGFGGSVLALVEQDQAGTVCRKLTAAYCRRFGRRCEACVTLPSGGATIAVKNI